MIDFRIQKKLGDFSLDIELKSDSRRIGILGASGSGKSMTLKCIAGIERPDDGHIVLDGREVYRADAKINVRPQERGVGYLFQNYALFPTMTVRENIAVGLAGARARGRRSSGKSGLERNGADRTGLDRIGSDRNGAGRRDDGAIDELLERFQIAELARRLPGELSGGQQQRVALARIMAYEPDVILLDEPYAALDAYLKDRLQLEMEEMLSSYEGTVLMVSHSRDEIYRFSETLLVIDKGRGLCFGEKEEIFREPKKKEAARLTGCKNIARIGRREDGWIEIPEWGAKIPVTRKIPEGATHVGVRAHDFVPIWGGEREGCVPFRVLHRANQPFEVQYYIAGGEEETKHPLVFIASRDLEREILRRGEPDFLAIPEEAILYLE